MSFKDTNITNPGTSIKYGADDMELYARLFNGVTTGIPAVTIKSTAKWGFWDNIAFFRNQADSRSTFIRGQSNVPATDVTLTLPPITANDVLPAIGLAQTWAIKQRFDAGVVLNQMSTPALPGSGLHHLFVAANGHLMKYDNAGALKDYDITAATIPADLKDGVIALRLFDCIVTKVSSTYYAIERDGTVLSSGTNPNTVVAAAIANGGSIWIVTADSTAIDLQAGFTGFTIPSDTYIYLGCDMNVPTGYTGFCFNITDDNSGIIGLGGGDQSIDEAGTASLLWTAIKIGTGLSTDSFRNVIVSDLRIGDALNCVQFDIDAAAEARNIVIEKLRMADNTRGIQFIVDDASDLHDVVIRDNMFDCGATTTDFFKDVKGTRIQFYGNMLDDPTGGLNEMNILSGSVDIQIFGGNHTGNVGTFTDAGTNTTIYDNIHTEWKIKGDAITPAQITADQHDYSPSGWNEKKNTMRISSDAMWMITGIPPGPNPKGRIIRLVNVGSMNIMLGSQNTGSTAANRFALVADTMIMPNQVAALYYDTSSSRWRPLADSMSLHAMTSVANVFTDVQTVKKNQETLLSLFRDINTVASRWGIALDARNSVSAQEAYVRLLAEIVTNTDGAEAGKFQVWNMRAGTLTKELELDQNAGLNIGFIDVTDLVYLYRNANATNSQIDINFDFNNSVGTRMTYADMRCNLDDATNGSEDATLSFNAMKAGTKLEILKLIGPDGSLRMMQDVYDAIEIYRPNNVVDTDEAGLKFSKNSSTSVRRGIAWLYAGMNTNTNADEDSYLNTWLMRDGTSRQVMTLGRRGTIQLGPDGSNLGFISRNIIRSGTGVNFNNTSAEQTLFSQNILADTMGSNGHLHLVLCGSFKQNQATATTYTLRIKFGGTTGFETSLGSLAQDADFLIWRLDLYVINQNSTGSQLLNGTWMMNTAEAATTGWGLLSDDEIQGAGTLGGGWTKDTAGSNNSLAVTCQMSVANAAAEMNVDYKFLEINPSIQ